MSQLGQKLRELLTAVEPDRAVTLQRCLELVIQEFECVAGTLHGWNTTSQRLELLASHQIPAVVLEKIRSIPIGKGMAGIAAERQAPVQVCNLQTDDSGVVRPGAKETKMEGSIACPILLDGELVGTLGIAKPTSYEFTNEQSGALMELATVIGEFGQLRT